MLLDNHFDLDYYDSCFSENAYMLTTALAIIKTR